VSGKATLRSTRPAESQERYCPICELVKEPKAFTTINKKTKSLDSYCKACRAKRARIKRGQARPDDFHQGAYKHVGEDRLPHVVDLVYRAIERGANTYEKIQKATRLDEDAVGDGLAYLLLRVEGVKTKVMRDFRYYFIVQS
jgi:hypothetical protein